MKKKVVLRPVQIKRLGQCMLLRSRCFIMLDFDRSHVKTNVILSFIRLCVYFII